MPFETIVDVDSEANKMLVFGAVLMTVPVPALIPLCTHDCLCPKEHLHDLMTSSDWAGSP